MGTKHTGQSVADFKKTSKIPDFTSQTFLCQFLPVIVEARGKDKLENYSSETIISRKQDNLLLTDPNLPNPLSFTNNLNNASAQSLLENVPKEILSSLQPVVEVYKVVNKGFGQTKNILLPFSNFKDPHKMDPLNRYAGRSPGHLAVGLREFSFDYLGTQPAEVDYFINCKLRLYCSSMDAFFHEYTDKEGDKVSFSDLIKRPVRTKHQRYDHKDFRIRVDVRYLTPDKSVLRDMIKNLGIQKKNKKEFMNNLHAAIKNSSTSFFLTLVRHEIDFATDVPSMPFEIAIDYNGSVETSLLSDDADLLKSQADLETLKEVGETNAAQNLRRFIKDNPQFQNMETNEDLRAGLRNLQQTEGAFPKLTAAGQLVQGLQKAGLIREAQDGPAAIKEYESFIGLVDEKERAHAIRGLDEANLRAQSYSQILTRLMGRDPRAETLRSVAKNLDLGGLGGARTDINTAQVNTSAVYKVDEAESLRSRAAAIDFENPRIKPSLIYTIPLDTKNDLMPWIKKRAVTSYSSSESGNINKLKRELEKAKKDKNQEQQKSIQAKINGIEKDVEKRREDLTSQSTDLANKIRKQKFERGLTLRGSTTEERQQQDSEFVRLQGLKKRTEGDEEQLKALQQQIGERKKSNPPGGRDTYNISYFYLGDLIDTALQILHDNNEGDKLELDFWTIKNNQGKTRVVLGEVEVFNPLKPTEVLRINVADLPVSMELWSDFWISNVVKKLKTRYTMKHFFRDVTAQLIPAIFPTRYLANGEVSSKVRVNVEYSSLSKDFPISVEAVEADITDLFTAHVATWAPSKDQEVVYFYGVSTKPTWLSGNKREDLAQGILYLPVGQEGTPLESISFSKADQPYYLEAKAEEGGILDDTTQLSEPYHCNFSVVGNTSIKPGRYVHISLPQLGGVSSNERLATGALTRGMILGIGGYFLINKVSNTLSANGNRIEWRTKADALWQTFGESKPLPSKIGSLAVTYANEAQKAGLAILGGGLMASGAGGAGGNLATAGLRELQKEQIQLEKEEQKTAERKAWKHGGASSVGSK